MNFTTTKVAANLLDNAVSDVARQQFQNAISGLNEYSTKERIQEACLSLDLLRSGGTPDYDDRLVAAMYLVQYQLQHINLTYSMVSAAPHRFGHHGRLTQRDALHVVDYGCGALATRFGVLFAVADALELGQQIDRVKIDSLDPAVPVVHLGVQIWERFITLVENTPDQRLQWLQQAIYRIDQPHPEIRLGVRLNQIEPLPNSDRWLSAIHVVYGGPQGNTEEVRENLHFLCEAMEPTLGFITSHKSKLLAAHDVSPFGDGYQRLQFQPSPRFLNQIPTPKCTAILREFRPNNWRVFWQWDPGTAFLVYGRHE